MHNKVAFLIICDILYSKLHKSIINSNKALFYQHVSILHKREGY